ncbi:hypothetical protein KIL84_019418 [Mauremys mutica]|uniref:Uncharacterized protein n=1 Tax=Mauremys mutica TaxID=74926 RepID=A0A9D3XS92_9SAUR|nr:hypothetical protein KIL84_019418 [Mauremys mutica]
MLASSITRGGLREAFCDAAVHLKHCKMKHDPLVNTDSCKRISPLCGQWLQQCCGIWPVWHCSQRGRCVMSVGLNPPWDSILKSPSNDIRDNSGDRPRARF